MKRYGLQMTQELAKFLTTTLNNKYATQSGTATHRLLRHVVIDDVFGDTGSPEIIAQIKQTPNLIRYFSKDAKTEVPIAGIINGTFISRRIDRLLIEDLTKTIYFIDYKTDINKTALIEKYKKQLGEYAQLLKSVYPNYKILGFVLWTHDWCLEQIIQQ